MTCLRLNAVVVLSFNLLVSNLAAAPCSRSGAEQEAWVGQRVNVLVRAARIAYANDDAKERYERVVEQIAGALKQCRLDEDRDFANRYPEFVEYMKLLSLAVKDDHELGFEVTDKTYFAETGKYTTIPDFLLTPNFLKSASRFETLPQAKAMLREMNAGRAADDQLLFFSYISRHLGTPDNPDSFRRLLIVVPGNPAQQIPEKWVQFGIPEPRRPASVRNVSVVAVRRGADETTNVYFKDFFRSYRRNGSVTVKGRWELGEGDDNCVECHKSGVLPIFPEAGSVSREERSILEAVNQRFLSYGPARFDRYLDPSKFGPGLGSTRPAGSRRVLPESSTCVTCHEPKMLGSLNWPMDSVLISSFVKGGQMPLGAKLQYAERARLYKQLVDDYFAIDEGHPGILKAWLLGKLRLQNRSQ